MPTDLLRLAEIVEAAEDLVAGGTQMSWETVQERMRPLIQEWRAIHEAANSPKTPLDDGLWQRFSRVIIQVTKEITAVAPSPSSMDVDDPDRGPVRAERETIIASIETINASDHDAYERVMAFRARWNELSRLRAASMGLRIRFGQALTRFFNHNEAAIITQIGQLSLREDPGGAAIFSVLQARIAALSTQHARCSRLLRRLESAFKDHAALRRSRLLREIIGALLNGSDTALVEPAIAWCAEVASLPGRHSMEPTAKDLRRKLRRAVSRSRRALVPARPDLPRHSGRAVNGDFGG